MATSFFNGESTFPENNTTDQLIDALQAQLADSAAESTAAQAAAVSAQASASNAAISEANVAGLSQAATDTLSQATTALAAANAAIASTAASATTATNKAAEASNSALGAANSATAAGISETNSAASAAAALASKNAAGTSESNAATSAAAALSSKNAAGTSETNAAASATAANTSKNNAATSETNAASSATAANASKVNAGTSETNAAASAAAALVSQNAAAASATLTTNQTAYLAGRNRIINGACSVAQRASVSVTGAQVYGQCDRWTGIIYGSAGGAQTLDQAAIALNSVNRFWVRETVTTPVTSLTGSNGWGGIQQLIEGFNSHDLLGKQVTISFWFVSNVTGNFSVALRDAPTSFSYITSFAATANVPVKVSFTTPTLPTGLSVPYSTAAGLVLSVGALSTGTLQCATGSLNTWASGTFVSAQGATNWGTTNGNFIAITDVQLEEGSVATPFERRQYGEEFALCQRYYEAGQTNVMQSPSTASAVGSQVKFSVAKRSPPTIALVRQFSSGAIPATSLSASPTSESVLVYVVTTAGGVMQAQDAWTASAEL